MIAYRTKSNHGLYFEMKGVVYTSRFLIILHNGHKIFLMRFGSFKNIFYVSFLGSRDPSLNSH
jgi:hypothetical protein